MDKTVIELFAGVGGFRVGLNDVVSFDKDGRAIERGPWKFVWANQWEPATKEQHAFDCYALRFGKEDSSNVDISKVEKKSIPDHTLLTGGFPCQDYSVARSLHDEKGIKGKKGVLWWQINDILKAKKPAFVLLENVDRLLKSPAKQRGQAFGIILRCFCEAGYGVQWRVINAAEYGHPQRRRRTFIFAFRKDTKYYADFKAVTKGKTVGEIDTTHFLANPKNKGRIGQVIRIYLGKNPDNDPSADFPEADLELKVTGLIGNSKKDETSIEFDYESCLVHHIIKKHTLTGMFSLS